MLYFSRLKAAAIIGACLLGVLFCIPNLMRAPNGWLPWRQIHLGLDLRGGSYLLMQVDMGAVAKEKLGSTVDQVRQDFRAPGIGYTRLAADQAANRVEITLLDPNQRDVAIKALSDLLTPSLGTTTNLADFDASGDGANLILTLSRPALIARATAAVTQSIEIIRRRIDSTGIVDPQIARQGTDRIMVQLPGISDPQHIKTLLGETAHMTFHLVDESANANSGEPPPLGDAFLPLQGSPNQKVAIRQAVMVDGANLTNAQAGQDPQNGGWVVNIEFDSLGARQFGDVTSANVGHPFAIVLDNQVISDPVIREAITGGRGQISGSANAQAATDLALLLRAGALPAPLTVIEEQSVGPELGANSIRAGAISLIVGFVLVIFFMGAFYGLFGWFANLALVVNLIMLMGILSLLQATLTLPGMAGILLTLGMAVDANILINERVREEVRNGRSPLQALEAGYRRAYGTIIDSNVTALLAHVMLFIFGSGPVRGFAVTITVGIVTTLFTATVFARLLTSRWYIRRRPRLCRYRRAICCSTNSRFCLTAMARPRRSRRTKGRHEDALFYTPLFRLVPDGTRIQFMKGRFAGLIVSAVLSLASVGLFFYPGLRLGIDFKGGVVMEARTPQPADFAHLRAALAAHNLSDAGLQRVGSASDNQFMIRLESRANAAATDLAVARVHAALDQVAPGNKVLSTSAVGASVSQELFRQGLLALGLSLLMILVYIWFRFEWQFAVGAVVTLILDITKTIGFLVVTRLQFDLVMVAAILTILGYSTNDKVVVYDRMRENLRKYKTMPLRQLIDQSINETLNRTLGTSMTVFLAALPLAIFGASVKAFAIVMLFGIVVGTSSSIFIAAPILLLLGENRLRRDAQPAKPESGKKVQARAN